MGWAHGRATWQVALPHSMVCAFGCTELGQSLKWRTRRLYERCGWAVWQIEEKAVL